MDQHLKEICEKAQAFKDALEKNKALIDEHRKDWNNTTKNLILSTFREVKVNVGGLNWDIQLVDAMENVDVITLGFQSEPSGIVGRVQGVFKFFAKESGRLIYNQVYNGEIYVSITYPHVEHHVAQQQPKFIGKFEPSELNHDLILDHISEFLDEMFNWEGGTRKLIGFGN
jgi:hypothetical protein